MRSLPTTATRRRRSASPASRRAAGQLIWELDPDAPRERVVSEQTVRLHEPDDARGGRARHRPPRPDRRRPRQSARPAPPRPIAMHGSAASPATTSPPSGSATTTTGRPRISLAARLPTTAWQKFMTYAHSNVDIKPVEGVDFVPAGGPIVIAEADPAEARGSGRAAALAPTASRAEASRPCRAAQGCACR